jgi:hypothetical protein
MHAESFERPMNLIEIMAAGRRSCTKSDAFVAALLPGMGYRSPRRRAMWATMVALACGVIGVVAVVVAVLTGHKFDHASSQAVVDPLRRALV